MSESGLVILTTAVFEIVPAILGVTIKVTVTLFPLIISSRLQIIIPVPEQRPGEAIVEDKCKEACSVSVSVKVRAVLGP